MNRNEESVRGLAGGGSGSVRSDGAGPGVPSAGSGGLGGDGAMGVGGPGGGTGLGWGGPATGGPGGPRRPIPPKLYRISEIVEYSRVSRQTIHNYTTMGLITEARRTRGGHRLYDESVFGRLDLIEELKGHNRSLRDIRTHFAELDQPA